MILLDAYALVAFLIGGPASAQVRALLREGEAAVATANLAEALDVCSRRYGLSSKRAMALLDPLFDEHLTAVPLDRDRACGAAEIRSRHYHRSSCPLSLADAVLLASAGAGDRIATPDPHILAVAAVENTGTLALPGQG